MRRFPAEFADLLTKAGTRVLDGRVSPADPFLARGGLIDRRRALDAYALLERALAAHLKPMVRAIPPETIANQTRNYQERLPKTVRVRSAHLDGRANAAKIARDIGLDAMLRSASYRAFAVALAGRALDPEFGRQALRYGPGDYSGPHTDHHPEDPRAAAGYFDLHLGFVGTGAARQLLVYARDGHLSETIDVARPGMVSAYRLPFWHYTTPFEGRPDAARWVILGTFYFS
ncbi:MAG: hypothetical protein ACKO1J_17075 [Tagaea sp.]